MEVRFGYTIAYVPDVAAALDFYGQAFGLKSRFIDPTGDYGELVTGDTTLAFAAESLGTSNIGSYRPNRADSPPPGIEFALITDDIEAAVAAALANGATLLAEPVRKPWGQVVGWVRDPNGLLIELGSEVSEAGSGDEA
jgi:lactoylglutathione lyase